MSTHPARRARPPTPPSRASRSTRELSSSVPLPVERSLIQLGPSLAATIPKEWAARLGLTKGSTVHLIFEADGVRVRKP